LDALPSTADTLEVCFQADRRIYGAAGCGWEGDRRLEVSCADQIFAQTNLEDHLFSGVKYRFAATLPIAIPASRPASIEKR